MTMARMLQPILAVLLLNLVAPRILADEKSMANSLSVDVHQILLPIVSENTLDDGRVENDPSRGRYAVLIEVDPPTGCTEWHLYVRADRSVLRPESRGKPCSHVKWKFNEEDATAYRPLQADESLVLKNTEGDRTQIALDMAVDLEWSMAPGSYDLGLVFNLVCQ